MNIEPGQILEKIRERAAAGNRTKETDLVEAGFSNREVARCVEILVNAGEIYKAGADGYLPLSTEGKILPPPRRNPKFKIGEIAVHKLTGDRVLILATELDAYDDVHHTVRTPNYRIVDVREMELVPDGG